MVFRALVFKLLVVCGAEAYVSGLQDAAASSLICGNKIPTRCKGIIPWLLTLVFRAVFFKLLFWCGAEGYVSGLQDAAY